MLKVLFLLGGFSGHMGKLSNFQDLAWKTCPYFRISGTSPQVSFKSADNAFTSKKRALNKTVGHKPDRFCLRV
jgi:hypothetical protein